MQAIAALLPFFDIDPEIAVISDGYLKAMSYGFVANMIFTPDEIYPTINDATKCGVFCNR